MALEGPSKEALDLEENRQFLGALDTHYRALNCAGVQPHHDLDSYLADIKGTDPAKNKPELGKNALRASAHYDLRRTPEAQERSQFLPIMRNVITPMVIDYFNALKRYMESRKMPKTASAEVDQVRRNVFFASALLLRQTEGTIPKFRPGTRFYQPLSNMEEAMELLIDFDGVRESTGFEFSSAPPVTGRYTGSVEIGDTTRRMEIFPEGMSLRNVVLLLNSQYDAQIFRAHEENADGQEGDGNFVASIGKNGLIEVAKETVSRVRRVKDAKEAQSA